LATLRATAQRLEDTLEASAVTRVATAVDSVDAKDRPATPVVATVTAQLIAPKARSATHAEKSVTVRLIAPRARNVIHAVKADTSRKTAQKRRIEYEFKTQRLVFAG
jgi:hypothetical protein